MQKRLMVVANWDWVLYNFRLPLLKSVKDEGVDVRLVCPDGQYVEALRAEGFRWLPWRMDRESMSPLRELKAVLDLLRLYRRYQPYAAHHITIKPIFYGSIAARLANVPAVINNFTGLGYLFSDTAKAKWLRIFVLPVLRWALRKQNVTTVLLNKEDQQRLVSEKVISHESSKVIPGDGVDLDRFHPPVEQGQSEDELTIVMASRLLWDKGVAEFIESAKRVMELEENIRFWLAGKPDPGNPSSIPQARVDDWQEEGVVEILGHRDDMSSILRDADIAVLPSYHEGVPVFLLEAAASGIPLIATDLEGCRMIIEDGKNGFLVPKRDVGELTRRLLTLIQDRELREKMGRHSREIVEKNYNQGQILNQFLSLYRSLEILPTERDGTLT